jgi:hypothetical protein
MENGPSLNILRDMNDRTFGVLRELRVEEGEYCCECGKKECGERLELLVIEYAAREERPLLAPGHKRVTAPVSRGDLRNV